MRRRSSLLLLSAMLAFGPLPALAVVQPVGNADPAAVLTPQSPAQVPAEALFVGDKADIRLPAIGGSLTDQDMTTMSMVSGVRHLPDTDQAEAPKGSKLSQLPEPATWAMMVGGFAIAGFALRRRLRASERRFTERLRRIAEGEERA